MNHWEDSQPPAFWQTRYYNLNVFKSEEVCGEAALHSPQSCEARSGGPVFYCSFKNQSKKKAA